MDGWMKRRKEGRRKGGMDGWMDGWRVGVGMLRMAASANAVPCFASDATCWR